MRFMRRQTGAPACGVQHFVYMVFEDEKVREELLIVWNEVSQTEHAQSLTPGEALSFISEEEYMYLANTYTAYGAATIAGVGVLDYLFSIFKDTGGVPYKAKVPSAQISTTTLSSTTTATTASSTSSSGPCPTDMTQWVSTIK